MHIQEAHLPLSHHFVHRVQIRPIVVSSVSPILYKPGGRKTETDRKDDIKWHSDSARKGGHYSHKKGERGRVSEQNTRGTTSNILGLETSETQPLIEDILFKHVNRHKVIIHPFVFLPPLLTCGV